MTLEAQYNKYLEDLQEESNLNIEPLTYDEWLETHSHFIMNSINKLNKKGSHHIFINVKMETYFFVNVSKHAYDFNNNFSGMLFSKRKDTGYEKETFMYLPKSFYDKKIIIGKANELTDDICKEIVEYSKDGYIDYLDRFNEPDITFKYAKDSLESLLQSVNMELETTLIMKKVDQL